MELNQFLVSYHWTYRSLYHSSLISEVLLAVDSNYPETTTVKEQGIRLCELKPDKIPAWRGSWSSSPRWRATSSWWLLGEGDQFSLRARPLVSQSPSIGWWHIQDFTDVTNWSEKLRTQSWKSTEAGRSWRRRWRDQYTMCNSQINKNYLKDI